MVFGLAAIVAGAGAVLVSSPPAGTRLGGGWAAGGFENPVEKQVLQLVAGQGDQSGRWRPRGVFAGGEDDEQRVGQHRQQRPASPGQPAAYLVFIEAGQALAGLEVLLHRPPPSGDGDQLDQPDRCGVIAAVEGQLAGAPGAADEQPPAPLAERVDAGLSRGGKVEPGPVVVPLPLRAGPG